VGPNADVPVIVNLCVNRTDMVHNGRNVNQPITIGKVRGMQWSMTSRA